MISDLILVIIRDYKSAFSVFCCFITWICVFFLAYYRNVYNLVLLKFTIKQQFILFGMAPDQYQHEIEAKCVSQSKMVAKA